MANTLLDALEKSQTDTLNQARTSLAPTGSDLTEQTRQIVRTGETGKAIGPSTGPRASSLSEKLANQETATNLAGVQEAQQQTQLEAEQADEVSRKADTIQNLGLEQKRQEAVEQFNSRVTAMMDDYRRSESELDLSKDKARVEQLGTMLRLSNQKYTDRLQMEGKRARLLSSVGQREAIQNMVFSDELDLLSSDLQFKSLMGDKQRTLSEKLANIDLNTAIQIANAQAQQASQSAMWSGVGDLASGAAKAYAAYNSKDSQAAALRDIDEQPEDLRSAFNQAEGNA